MFVSPIHNYGLFSMLKKRLEIAYEIQQDFKYMMREMERHGPGLQRKRISISRISPYLDHYKQNCCVKGIHEIEYILGAVERSKARLKELKAEAQDQLLKQLFKGISSGPPFSLSDHASLQNTLMKFNQAHNDVEIDFERKEKDIRQCQWLVDVGILYVGSQVGEEVDQRVAEGGEEKEKQQQ